MNKSMAVKKTEIKSALAVVENSNTCFYVLSVASISEVLIRIFKYGFSQALRSFLCGGFFSTLR